MTTWILLAGLPGTGKSTLAKALAARLNAAILDKDRVRAALFPGPLTDYSEPQAQLCMAAMLRAAAYLTEQQRVPYVFFDGRTFSKASQRREVIEAAETAGAHWRLLQVSCSAEVAEARLARTDPGHPAKNRDAALYRSLQSSFESIQEPSLVVDTTDGFDAQLEAVVAYLRAGVR